MFLSRSVSLALILVGLAATMNASYALRPLAVIGNCRLAQSSSSLPFLSSSSIGGSRAVRARCRGIPRLSSSKAGGGSGGGGGGDGWDYSTAPKLLRINHSRSARVSIADRSRAIEIIEGYITKERIERMQAVLKDRCLDIVLLYENPMNSSNVYACMRTMDSFGIQNVIIVNAGYEHSVDGGDDDGEGGGAGSGDGAGASSQDSPKIRIKKKSAVGSDKWLSVKLVDTGGPDHQGDSVVSDLKKSGYKG